MSVFPNIVSFYTVDTMYQMEVQNLISTCKKFYLEYSIDGVESFGSWELNCSYKPFYLYQKMQQLQKPILWVDADAIFVRKPTYLDLFSADFATRINEEIPDSHPSKVMSGTVYVNNTPKGIEILRLWAKECIKQLTQEDRKEEFWDQIALRDVLLSNPKLAQVQSLPLSYVKIAGHPNDEELIKEPIIEHFQASRRYKQSINGTD